MYPKSLKEQYEFLLDNLEFFKTFGKYTEPYEDKIVAKIVKKYKNKSIKEKLKAPFEIKDMVNTILKKIDKIPLDKIYSVKEMEDKKIIGSCTEFALFTSAILRKLDFPTAMIYTVKISSVFQDPENTGIISGHTYNIVYDGTKWWAIDARAKILTRFLVSRVINSGYIPGLIFRDLEDLNINNRRKLYLETVKNLREILLLDLQVDLLERYIEWN
jgi:hypothetical protein